ncbi:MAG: AbrB/MazE/SpoVT family DNA-binding domain-containing protein [Clostridia bacterium]|nr:AbrB/MazE/SpoVT family DNA-binding domain-containing protein [Clostridia bacterium]
MKSTGIVRPIDDLGRIVLPIEIRKTLELSPKDSVEIFIDGNRTLI